MCPTSSTLEQSKRLRQQIQDLNAKVLQLARDNETPCRASQDLCPNAESRHVVFPDDTPPTHQSKKKNHSSGIVKDGRIVELEGSRGRR